MMKSGLKSILIILTIWTIMPTYGQDIIDSYRQAKKDSLEKIKLIALVNEKIKNNEAKGVLTACRSLIREKSITGEEKSLKSSYFQYKKDLKLDLPIPDSIFEKTIDNIYQSIKNK